MFRPAQFPPQDGGVSVNVVFQEGRLITDMRAPDPCLISGQQLDFAGWQPFSRHFMGFWQEQPCYAVAIAPEAQLDVMQYEKGSLYHILGRVEDQLFAVVGRAFQLLGWERDHQFCGRCGAPMRPDTGERAMHCDACGNISYPRIAPCIITLVTRGEEMLLARNTSFRQPMYSTLAGFIEAGETAEETLVREVREEVGLDVGNLRYFQSQSWPFPNQLMLGFFAEYAGGEIVCDESEIADARWFHYRDLPMVPPPSSVSGRLIRHYIDTLE